MNSKKGFSENSSPPPAKKIRTQIYAGPFRTCTFSALGHATVPFFSPSRYFFSRLSRASRPQSSNFSLHEFKNFCPAPDSRNCEFVYVNSPSLGQLYQMLLEQIIIYSVGEEEAKKGSKPAIINALASWDRTTRKRCVSVGRSNLPRALFFRLRKIVPRKAIIPPPLSLLSYSFCDPLRRGFASIDFRDVSSANCFFLPCNRCKSTWDRELVHDIFSY